MWRQLTLLSLSWSGFWAASASGQTKTPVYLRLEPDQQVYVTGEDVWVDIWMDKPHTDSRFTRLRLLDRNGRLRSEAVLPLETGSGSGYLTLPDDLPTDTYFLDAIPSRTPATCRVSPILVVNPRMPPTTACRNPSPGKPSPGPVDVKNGIRIRLEKDSVNTRSPVSLTWSSPEGRPLHDIVCRITRTDALSRRMDSLSETFQLDLNHPALDPRNDQGHLIRARVTRYGRPILNFHAICALKGRQANISTATSDSLGILEFLLPRSYDPARLVLLSHEEKSGDIRWEWYEPEPARPIEFPCFPWDATLRTDLEDRILNSRLEQRYHPEGVRSVEMSETDTTDFYGKPDHRYLLDDYTRFPVMEEVFTEIIPQMRLKKDNGRPILQVLNSPFKSFFPKQALILLDGIPVTDGQSILDTDPLRVQSIDIVSRSFTLGQTDYPGIIHLKSYRSDMAGIPLPQGSSSYPFPGIQRPSILPEPASGSPSLRNLLWKEQVPAKSGLTSLDMRFHTSDAVGTYRIYISGRDAFGAWIHGETSIFVGQGLQ